MTIRCSDWTRPKATARIIEIQCSRLNFSSTNSVLPYVAMSKMHFRVLDILPWFEMTGNA